MADAELEISPDPVALAEQAAEWIVAHYEATTGRFSLNLSGGSTPERLYRLLAHEIYRRKFDWERVHVFFGDERFVPMDHQDSNFRMAREALLDHVPIPAENVHPVRTDLASPAEAAADYEATLKAFYGKETLDVARPLFSLTLLGLGEDGHTASLFPGTAVLDERTKWVDSIIGAKPEPRISMTYPVLEASAATAFLVAGAGKKPMLARLLARDHAIPSGRLKPQGEFVVLCDEQAAPDGAPHAG